MPFKSIGSDRGVRVDGVQTGPRPPPAMPLSPNPSPSIAWTGRAEGRSRTQSVLVISRGCRRPDGRPGGEFGEGRAGGSKKRDVSYLPRVPTIVKDPRLCLSTVEVHMYIPCRWRGVQGDEIHGTLVPTAAIPASSQGGQPLELGGGGGE